MFRKPVRTYERKRRGGRVRWQPSSGTSMIVREDVRPRGETEATRTTDPRIFLDDDLDYDPFDTTFDRIARESQSRAQPIPPSRSSDSSYSDSSDPSLNEDRKDAALLDFDPFVSLEVVEQPAKKPGNKRRRLDPEPTTTTTTTTTTKKTAKQRGTRGRGRGARKSKDENAEPNLEAANDLAKKPARKSSEKKAPERKVARAPKKRKGRVDSPLVKRCSVNLERVSVGSLGDSLVESKLDESFGGSRPAANQVQRKNPVVALSRLSVAKPASDFSSSTPIVARRYTRDRTALRLSPITNEADREDESKNENREVGSLKFSAGEVSTGASSSTGKTSVEGKKEKERKGSVRILGVTPDPEASELLFDDTEDFNGESRNVEEPRSSSGPQKSPGLPKESSESLDLTYVDDDENARNSTGDPFMGSQTRDPPRGRYSSGRQSHSSDEWSTTSGSLEVGGGIAEMAKYEPSTSGENDSNGRPDEFARAETPERLQSTLKTNTNDLQPVVLLARLTFGKLGQVDSGRRDEDLRSVPEVVIVNDESSSRSIDGESSSRNIYGESSARSINGESFSRVIDGEPSSRITNEESSSSTLHEESSLRNTKDESFDDFEAAESGMESLRVDDSSENITGLEESSTGILPDENGNETEKEFVDRELPTTRSAKPAGDSASPIDEEDKAPFEKPTEVHENDRSREEKAAGQPVVLLTRLNDPFRVTRRRDRYRNWDLKLTAITESNEKVPSRHTEELVAQPDTDEAKEKPEVIAEQTTDERNSENTQVSGEMADTQRLDEENCPTTSDEINRHNESTREDKVVFLKPGKSWARSLSILSQVHSQGDLESLAAGKGRKWRESVQSLLGMQQQGHLQSCLRKNEDCNELPIGVRNSLAWIPGSSQPDTSRLFSIGSPARFIRRVSIRVLPDPKSFRQVKDTSFLEAYGISPAETQETNAQRCTLLAPEKCLDIVQSPVSSVKYRDVVLAQCGQDTASPFEKSYPEEYLENCRKIGEGVYGEVFLYEKESTKSVIKIIPIEGETKINGERQKKFDEILSEIVIAKQLHNLRFESVSRTSNFVEVKNVRCVVGKYPPKLIDLWKIYDDEKSSENDCPSIFEEDQLYIVLELGHGGEDLEAYLFQNAGEAHALFMQAAAALAVAEETLEFEHRDLHWGNLLISRTDESQIDFRLNDKPISLTTKGVRASVIDFTLSRMSYEGCSIFNDLSMDEDLFVAQGEYQFDIYRLMRKKLENDWQRFEPYTNVLWLHYLLDKMITAVRYRRKTTKVHKNGIAKLQELKNEILEYKSAADFVTSCDKATRPRTSRTSVANVVST